LQLNPVFTDRAPVPVGPYSQAVSANGFLFISGQLPINPLKNEMIEGDISEATRQCLKNIKAILNASGAELHHVVKVTVYTVKISKFAQINEVYREFFHEPYPARAVVEVSALPGKAQVEIEAVAAV